MPTVVFPDGAGAAVLAVSHDLAAFRGLVVLPGLVVFPGVVAGPMAVDLLDVAAGPMAVAGDGGVLGESMVSAVCRSRCTTDISGISPSRRAGCYLNWT